ncbi:hypothetical protein PIN31115_02085 [Pandoraea iniqua]|uniref:Uncharacterized protein n=1 Tax=Pandoraea iniqua TaxID=2508288 RepID=A0A5E4UKS9_9BURK|nr:hypothetical protein [Pandoraea iniqua]VVE00631.1 hypothetical protein PIN31115_02085 [Pandoraea iniqua]
MDEDIKQDEQPIPEGAEVAAESGENVAVTSAVEAPAADLASAPAVSQSAGMLPIGVSSGDEALTFEERVEKRFLALEGFLVKLPHSIAHAISQGSAEPEELAKRALAHLFSQDQ